MSILWWMCVGSVLLHSFSSADAFPCPNASFYNNILNIGCYKIVQMENRTWAEARRDCENDTNATVNGSVVPGVRAHLLSIEHSLEMTGLSRWLDAYGLHKSFFTDGDLGKSMWNWSTQSINWFFTAEQRNIIGNGSLYTLTFNPNSNDASKYRIKDDAANARRQYICEYQVPCNSNGSCRNGATCYINMGQDLCLCAPGYTGADCSIDINECLQSPCQHGGSCADAINNYTCDCSQTFHGGPNCETPQDDLQGGQRAAAFWSVLGVVTGLVVLLTVADLPWEDILSAIGCSFHRFACCAKEDERSISANDLHLADSAVIYDTQRGKKLSLPSDMAGSSKGSYHIMNTVWDPEYAKHQTPANVHYGGDRSPEQPNTPPTGNVRSYTNVVMVKGTQNQLVNVSDRSGNVSEGKGRSNDSVDAMVNWTQQLQEQLKSRSPRETSASSTKQLIHKTSSNDS